MPWNGLRGKAVPVGSALMHVYHLYYSHRPGLTRQRLASHAPADDEQDWAGEKGFHKHDPLQSMPMAS